MNLPKKDILLHKALGSVQYCIKIETGLCIKKVTNEIGVKLEKTEPAFKEEISDDTTKFENNQTEMKSEKLDCEFDDPCIEKIEVPHSLEGVKESTVYEFKKETNDESSQETDLLPYKCGECDYITERRRNLDNHINSKHLNIRFVCDLCEYKAMQKGDLKRHVIAQHESK